MKKQRITGVTGITGVTDEAIAIAEIKVHLQHLVESDTERKKGDKELLFQVKQTNGRVTQLEEAKKTVDKKLDGEYGVIKQLHLINSQVISIKSFLNKVVIGAITAISVASLGGWYFFTAGINDYIDKRIEVVLSNLEFELVD